MDPLSEACDAAIGCEIHLEVLAINIARAPRDGHRVQWMSASSPLLGPQPHPRSSARHSSSRMSLPTARFLLALLVALTLASARAGADDSKLDPLARRALARLDAGAAPRQLRDEGAAVNGQGDLDVFIVGTATRRSWKPRARIRTALPGISTASSRPGRSIGSWHSPPSALDDQTRAPGTSSSRPGRRAREGVASRASVRALHGRLTRPPH